MNHNAQKLLELASQKFGTLTDREKGVSQAHEKLFRAVAEGELADYSTGVEAENHPAGAENWGDERVLKADRIAWLCTDREASALVTRRGIRVKGARIDGTLDLEQARIPFALDFERSSFPDGANLRHASICALHLEATYTGPIQADEVRVEGSVLLRNGFKAEGEVRLNSATIAVNLECDKSHFVNAGKVALQADSMRVGGHIFLRNGFSAEGEVRLSCTTIGRNLECDAGQFINPDNPDRGALTAEGLKVEGNIFLRHGFKARGEVALLATRVRGCLHCDGGQFANRNGNALNADSLKAGGSVFLRNGFQAEGHVRLVGATIGGDLDCAEAHFINPEGNALSADGFRVQGCVRLDDRFKAEGEVRLVGATIDGYLALTGVDSDTDMTLDLRSARIGTLWDDQRSWPKSGKLFLHGLAYQEIHDDAPTDPETRVKWLRLQPKDHFRPKPYEQLAEVLRKGGHGRYAKRILIAKEEEKAQLTEMSIFETCWHHLYGWALGYGYTLWRAFWLGVTVVAVGWVSYGIGDKVDLITPSKVGPHDPQGNAENRELSEGYPRFNFWVYSVDVFVPLIDLHQESHWLPKATLWKQLGELGGPKLILGWWLRCWFWFQIIAGWMLTTLLIMGLTQLVHS